MKILKCEKLVRSYELILGDQFQLHIDGKIVHTIDICQNNSLKYVSMWALLDIKSNLAYIIGGDNLLQDLLDVGFKDERLHDSQ